MLTRVCALAMIVAVTTACVRKTPEMALRDRIILTELDLNNIKGEIVSQLKDPDSARFGDIAATRFSEDKVKICGFVNARNSFGGYTGQTPFVMYRTKSGTFIDLEIAETNSYGVAMISVCRDQGVVI